MMDFTPITNALAYIPENIHTFLTNILLNFLPEKTALRSAPVLYWLIIFAGIWLTVSLIQKMNVIVKVIIIILLAILIAGFFVPF
jgi:hypothetical protein